MTDPKEPALDLFLQDAYRQAMESLVRSLDRLSKLLDARHPGEQWDAETRQAQLDQEMAIYAVQALATEVKRQHGMTE